MLNYARILKCLTSETFPSDAFFFDVFSLFHFDFDEGADILLRNFNECDTHKVANETKSKKWNFTTDRNLRRKTRQNKNNLIVFAAGVSAGSELTRIAKKKQTTNLKFQKNQSKSSHAHWNERVIRFGVFSLLIFVRVCFDHKRTEQPSVEIQFCLRPTANQARLSQLAMVVVVVIVAVCLF